MTVQGNKDENRELRLKLQRANARIAELEAQAKQPDKKSSSHKDAAPVHEKKMDFGKSLG